MTLTRDSAMDVMWYTERELEIWRLSWYSKRNTGYIILCNGVQAVGKTERNYSGGWLRQCNSGPHRQIEQEIKEYAPCLDGQIKIGYEREEREKTGIGNEKKIENQKNFVSGREKPYTKVNPLWLHHFVAKECPVFAKFFKPRDLLIRAGRQRAHIVNWFKNVLCLFFCSR